MKNKLAIITAASIGVFILILSFAKEGVKKRTSYDVVFFGDSIIACDHNDAWTIPIMLENQMGLNVLNAAIGGSTLCDVSSTQKVGDSSPLYAMVSLVKAISLGDFSLQIMGSQKNNVYIDEWRYKVISDLGDLNWEDVKYLIIEQGANDYLTGVPIDDKEDPYNSSTFGGALRVSIEALSNKVESAKIVLLTPIYMFPEGCEEDCLTKDFGGGTLDRYVEKEIEIANEYGVILIDNFHELDINRDNYQSYIPGGLHGNYDGNKLITDNIVKHLRELDEGN